MNITSALSGFSLEIEAIALSPEDYYQSLNPKSVIFSVLQFSETVLTVVAGIPFSH